MFNSDQPNSSFQGGKSKTGKLCASLLKISCGICVLVSGCGNPDANSATTVSKSPENLPTEHRSPSATPAAQSTSVPAPTPRMLQSEQGKKTSQIPGVAAFAVSAATPMIDLEIYRPELRLDKQSRSVNRSEGQCSKMVSETLPTPTTGAIEKAVGRVLAKNGGAESRLAGYRVALNAGVATIDLRPLNSAQRSWPLLSRCEQIALYSSLQKTLTTNSELSIRSLELTERGQRIDLSVVKEAGRKR